MAVPGLASIASAAVAADDQVTAQYAVYTHGFHVADVTIDYRLTDWGYGIRSHLVAGGFLSWLLHMDIQSQAEGRFIGDRAMPIRYESKGFSRGRHRDVILDYKDGAPHVTTLDPPEPKRAPVEASALSNALDTLSAMALLLKTVRTTGACNGSANIFDGLRLTAMVSHGPVKAEVPDGYDRKFGGAALRCDFVGRQTGGFITGSDNVEKFKAPHAGAAWFQNLSGLGLVAVRVQFEHPKIGTMVAVLKNAPQVH